MRAALCLLVLMALPGGCSAGGRPRAADSVEAVGADSVVGDDAGSLKSVARPSGGSATVQIFFIVLEGATKAEKIGCGDGIVGVAVDADGTKGPLRFALEQLLGNREVRPAGTGAYNALYRTALRVDSATVRDGEAIVGLSGNFSYGGVCDAPRIEAQLTRTATQFSTVRAVSFYINGTPLRDLLSEK